MVDKSRFLVYPIDAITPISKGNSDSQMHSWSETSLWWLHYSLGDDFMEHIRAPNPYRTILDVCALPE